MKKSLSTEEKKLLGGTANFELILRKYKNNKATRYICHASLEFRVLWETEVIKYLIIKLAKKFLCSNYYKDAQMFEIGENWSSYLFCIKGSVTKTWDELQVSRREIREKFLEWVISELK